MGDKEGLTLEKLEINNRLTKVENKVEDIGKHLQEGVENRKALMDGFSKLESKIDKVDEILFGGENVEGVVHQLKDLKNIASGVWGCLKYILLSIVVYILINTTPTLLTNIGQILKSH